MKGFFKKLFRSGSSEDFIEFKVKCNNCSEVITVGVSLKYDLQQDMDSEAGGYILKKEIQDSKCFRVITMTAKFNMNKDLIDKSISGGEFIDQLPE